jgi:dienelactone hydrolase
MNAWPELYQYLYHRMIHFGVGYGDLQQITAEPEQWDVFCERLANFAEQFAKEAQQSLTEKHQITARDYFRRSVDYYHFAQMRTSDLNQAQRYREYSRGYFQQFAALEHSALKRFEFPFQGTVIPGYVNIVNRRAPCIILFGGLDSAKEVELYYFSKIFFQRGLSVCYFDCPGQGELNGKLPMISYFDSAIQILIDWLLSGEMIQPAALGAFGVSLGGYLVLRAWSQNPPIKACISLSGFYNYEVFRHLRAGALPTLNVALFGKPDHPSIEQLKSVSLNELAADTRRPILLVHGTRDHLVNEVQIEKLKMWAPHIEININEGAEHVCTSRFSFLLPHLGDWMSKQFE